VTPALPPLSPFDPALPLERAHTLPASWYTDPAVHAAERTAIFGRSWQFVGRTEQVAEPGQYVTADVAGEPVLAVRGDDGELRAFFNVCRHRASPILNDAAGCVGKLRCRYHGWTYDLAGRLKGTPEFDGVCDFNKDTNGLVPVGGVEVFGPWVWVRVETPSEAPDTYFYPFTGDLTPRPPLRAGEGVFKSETQSGETGASSSAVVGVRERSAVEHPISGSERGPGGEVSNLLWHARRSYDLACNWKVYVDNYLDGGYHVNTVHPALAGAIDYQQYRTDVFPRCSVQTSPLKAAGGAVGATRTGDAAYWWLWPNFMVNIYSGVMDTNLVLPLAPDRCRVIFDFYFAAGTDEAFIANSVAVADEVQAEDVLICEQVQRGLGSRSYTTGRFSVKRENGGYAFHRLVAEAVGVPPSGGL
jgi:choline monooxygenase